MWDRTSRTHLSRLSIVIYFHTIFDRHFVGFFIVPTFCINCVSFFWKFEIMLWTVGKKILAQSSQ